MINFSAKYKDSLKNYLNADCFSPLSRNFSGIEYVVFKIPKSFVVKEYIDFFKRNFGEIVETRNYKGTFHFKFVNSKNFTYRRFVCFISLVRIMTERNSLVKNLDFTLTDEEIFENICKSVEAYSKSARGYGDYAKYGNFHTVVSMLDCWRDKDLFLPELDLSLNNFKQKLFDDKVEYKSQYCYFLKLKK